MRNKFEEQSEGSQSKFDQKAVKSCDDKFNQETYNQDDEKNQQKQPRAAKSFVSDEGSGWDEMTKEQRKQATKQWKDQVKEDQSKPKDRIKQKKQNNFSENNRKFTQEIVDSQSVSLHQSARSELNFDKMEKEEAKIKVQDIKNLKYFNIMLVGAASTGKTTYKNCFLRQYKHQQPKNEILGPTQDIEEHQLSPRPGQLNLKAAIVDTPGFEDRSFSSYLQLIYKEITSRNQKYIQEYNKTMRVSSIYSRQERVAEDCRIHCCLLFFRGPRINNDDWELLKLLQNQTNVIPVIAKGDSYTISEVKQMKQNIIDRARKQMITWFDAVQYIRQKYPELLPQLQEGPYGRSPPFMIVGSTSKIDGNGKLRLSREYRWGTCYIENQNHTQFNILNRLLMDYFRDGLVKLLEIKTKRKSQGQIKMKAQNKRNNFLIFAIGGITAIGIGLWLKDNIPKK